MEIVQLFSDLAKHSELEAAGIPTVLQSVSPRWDEGDVPRDTEICRPRRMIGVRRKRAKMLRTAFGPASRGRDLEVAGGGKDGGGPSDGRHSVSV